MSRQLAALVYSRRVDDFAMKAVLAYCAEKASNDGTGVWPSRNTIAGALDCGKSTVIRAFRALVERGLLVQTGTRPCANGVTNVYRLDVPAIEALPKVKADRDDKETGVTLTPVPAGHPTGAALTPKPSMNRPLEGDEEMAGDPADDPQEALDVFNAFAAENGWWSKALRLSDARKAKLRARLKEAGGIDGWKAALIRACASDYLMGRVNGFQPGIDFFCQESSFLKLMEGSYDNRPGVRGSRGNVAILPSAGGRRTATGIASIVAQSRLRR